VTSRFKRLTDAEARTLTRRELLDRVEAEQRYWMRKKITTDADREASREFSRILFTYLDLAEGMRATIDYIEGRGRGDYWDTRPGDEERQ
jgi:triphosphoribosyl-dephospho-CoA synthetase